MRMLHYDQLFDTKTSEPVLYGFSISYVVFPFIGLPFSGADVVSLVGGLPEGVKLAGKAILAAPFSFHVWNGFRHLAWDATKCA